MIHNKSRAHWIGASDTNMLFAKKDTKSFDTFWAVKLGYITNNFTTRAMLAGTNWEGRILDYLDIKKRDRQIRIKKLRLRVNLDGEDDTFIYEVKTHSADKPFHVTTAYWRQAQVEMYITGKRLKIVSYGLAEDDYNNYFNPVVPSKLDMQEITYNPDWIEYDYLPRLRHAAYCLKKKRWITYES